MTTALLMTTRYDQSTWEKYTNWKTQKKVSGAFYNTPLPISEKISPDSILYVLEMNNSTNRIMGIGIIQNKMPKKQYFHMFDNECFNRYHYHSSKHISREMLSYPTLLLQNGVWISLLELLELICFKSARHSKRSRGISKLPSVYFKGVLMTHIINLIEKCSKSI